MSGQRKHQASATNWEDSFYGGYVKLLYDFPDVVLGKGIYVVISPNTRLGYYLGQKLVRLFLQRIPLHNIVVDFIQDARLVSPKDLVDSGKDGKWLRIQETALKNTLAKVIINESELVNLFRYYESEIIGADIWMEIPLESIGIPIIVNDSLVKIRAERPERLRDIEKWNDTVNRDEFKPVFILQQPGEVAQYGTDERYHISRLINKLDISFDSDRDEVKCLRQGKIDTNKLAELVAFNDRIYKRILEDQKTKPFKVVILCDESGSMKYADKIRRQLKLVKILYGAFSALLPPEDINIYGHSGGDQPEIYVYQDCYNHTFEGTISKMLTRTHASNYDGPVIEAIHRRIRQQTAGAILMVVISDGLPEGNGYGGSLAVAELKRIIEKCKRDRFVIMGIGFAFDGVKTIYSYHSIISDMAKIVESTTVLLNTVVKNEFKSI